MSIHWIRWLTCWLADFPCKIPCSPKRLLPWFNDYPYKMSLSQKTSLSTTQQTLPRTLHNRFNRYEAHFVHSVQGTQRRRVQHFVIPSPVLKKRVFNRRNFSFACFHHVIMWSSFLSRTSGSMLSVVVGSFHLYEEDQDQEDIQVISSCQMITSAPRSDIGSIVLSIYLIVSKQHYL